MTGTLGCCPIPISMAGTLGYCPVPISMTGTLGYCWKEGPYLSWLVDERRGWRVVRVCVGGGEVKMEV